MDARRQDLTNSIGLLILRLGLGGYMLTHGLAKMQRMIDGDWNFGDPLGIGPGLSLFLAGTAEFFGAIFVMLGAATRVAAAPLVFTMIVAAFVAHAADPWTIAGARAAGGGGSKQLALMYGAGFLALIFTGAGKFSVDGMVWPRVRQWRRNRKN